MLKEKSKANSDPAAPEVQASASVEKKAEYCLLQKPPIQ
jgi:hypothetical protein